MFIRHSSWVLTHTLNQTEGDRKSITITFSLAALDLLFTCFGVGLETFFIFGLGLCLFRLFLQFLFLFLQLLLFFLRLLFFFLFGSS